MNLKIKKILLKKNKSKIVSLTAYSKSVSKILDKHCDIILVGDSMANVLYGLKNTGLSSKNLAQNFFDRNMHSDQLETILTLTINNKPELVNSVTEEFYN